MNTFIKWFWKALFNLLIQINYCFLNEIYLDVGNVCIIILRLQHTNFHDCNQLVSKHIMSTPKGKCSCQMLPIHIAEFQVLPFTAIDLESSAYNHWKSGGNKWSVMFWTACIKHPGTYQQKWSLKENFKRGRISQIYK